MTTTDTLFETAPLVQPDAAPDLTIQQRFEAFHEANGWVILAFEALIADWLAHGHSKVGVKAQAEIIRWTYGRQTHGDEFRLNNSLVSRYARLLIERNPAWSDAIEIRELRAA